ncbi:MAG TPA: hypothetical protein QF620_00345 [Candidatus Paceibacterota bacterium]|jgi:hypothetical protein|nr:hypothetical protein [Parcubacteria group bacterium]MDP6249291.1 hypothetical protein [Candidatus Paceibacterota bacterium]MDP7159415.1 hypothetical protein [Candidatus Paceibacterota bacterium]MDP7367229.1 hypothetical protein [Candidatus Paceibacterota bacterium]HJL55805.1 hypothetical protein [Candidatus Paceibacterota bacterium]
MLNTIERLREKPRKYRMRVAFIVSASIAGVIFLVWLSILGVRFKNNDNTAGVENSEPVFAEFRERFSGVYEEGKSQFEEVKEELENIVQ